MQNNIAPDATNSKTISEDDVLLQDPDAGTQSLTLSSFSYGHDLQANLIAHLVEGPESIVQVAAKVLEHKFFDSWGHKKIAEIVLEHYRKYGERPPKKMLASLLRQAGASRKDIEAHVASLEALKYEPLESVGFWTDTIVAVSQRYQIATAQKKLTENSNLSEFYEAVSAARQLDGQLQEYSLMSPDELQELDDLEWQIAGHFPKKGTVTVFGASGAGKSFYCIDQALCIASGTPFLGQHEAKAGKVLYLCSEGSYGLKGRVKAWQEGHKVKQLENIVFSTVCHNLQDRGEIDQLISKAKAKLGGIDAVFVDTLSRNFGSGDTDKNADMQTYLRNIDYIREKTGATVINVHHTGWSDVGRERGAKSIRDYADSSICIEVSGAQIKVSCKKQKDAAEFAEYFLNKVPSGGSLYLELGAKPVTDNEDTEAELLDYIPDLPLTTKPTLENTISVDALAAKAKMTGKQVRDRLKKLDGIVCRSRFSSDARFPYHYWQHSECN